MDYSSLTTIETHLPDMNNALDNTIYRLQCIDCVPLNAPSDYLTDASSNYLITLSYDTESLIQKQQYILDSSLNKVKWERVLEKGIWSEWNKSAEDESDKSVITCGEGKQYTKLRDAIEMGCRNGSTVIVYPGTYDLKEEFKDVEINHDAVGIPLYGGVHVKFLAGSYVKAIFDNTDRWIYDHFQPFYSRGDFTLEGLNIDAANTRYCVHDEHGGVGIYHHVYKDCVMKYTNEHEDINYVQCIGGGLGEHGYIEIDGGYYESYTTVGYANMTAEESQQPITYHNGVGANCDSKIFIKNVYLANKGYFRFGDYGASTTKSKVFINGCSMGKEILQGFENSSYSNINFEIIEFNNVVRN